MPCARSGPAGGACSSAMFTPSVVPAIDAPHSISGRHTKEFQAGQCVAAETASMPLATRSVDISKPDRFTHLAHSPSTKFPREWSGQSGVYTYASRVSPHGKTGGTHA